MRALLLVAIVVGSGCGDSASGGMDGGDPGDGGPSDGDEGDGPPVSDCPPGTWCREDVPASAAAALLHAVDAVSGNDVFAVGDGGVILRRQNGAWAEMTSGTTSSLRDVWAASGSDAWAVGQGGTVLRWNGTEWRDAGSAPDIDYTAVWGAAPDDVWMVGTGTYVHWDGTQFTQRAATGTPVGVSGTGPNDVWVAGETGFIYHYTGTWMALTSEGTGHYSVYARTPTDVWFSRPGIGTKRFDGAAWTMHATDTTLFASMYASAADRAFGVGNTRVGVWNGTAWTLATPIGGLTGSLFGITGVGPHVWVVGANGTILYRGD